MLNGWLVLGIIVWLYGLSVFKRTNLTAFFFWWGSAGLFIISAFICHVYFVWLVSDIVTATLGVFGWATHWFVVYPVANLIQMPLGHNTLQIFVDYECSGVIELLAFESLLTFFPIYNRKTKILTGVVGALWIYLANVIRLLLIIVIVKVGGIDTFFIAHSIIARLLFYILVIVLYYSVFTQPQVVNRIANRFNNGGQTA